MDNRKPKTFWTQKFQKQNCKKKTLNFQIIIDPDKKIHNLDKNILFPK